MKPQQHPVAIIGAGMCGLTLAKCLQAGGVQSVVVEKSSAFGGRFATQQTDGGAVDSGIAWPELAEGLIVEKNRRVIRLSIAPGAESWHLTFEGPGTVMTACAVVCTQPVPQALELLQSSFRGQLPGFKEQLEKIRYRPSVVLTGNLAKHKIKKRFKAKGPFELVVCSEEEGLYSASRASTIYLGEKFSKEWFERPESEVLLVAKRLFEKTYGVSLESPQLIKRRYARAVSPSAQPFLMAPIHPALYFAGDGFAGGEVEGALRSAYAVAGLLS